MEVHDYRGLELGSTPSEATKRSKRLDTSTAQTLSS